LQQEINKKGLTFRQPYAILKIVKRKGADQMLRAFLKNEVMAYDGADQLDEEQINNVVRGLEFYISDYLAEQIPEQIDNELEN
jgi:hypothetical protein